MTAPFVHTASGVAFDLLAPRADKVRFAFDIAPALARLPRFNGHVSSGPYSVAQHSVIGAEVLLAERGRVDLAAWFLLHDAHEAYLGDIARPVAAALAAVGGEMIAGALGRLRHQIDAAIFEAARLPLPSSADRALVTDMDDRMLETERRMLLAQCERHWDTGTRAIKLKGGLKPWAWPVAADRWLALYRQLCPRGAL